MISINKKETAQLLYIVKANYPKYYKGIIEEEFADMVDVWYLCLNDYDYSLAQAGVKIYLTSDTKGYPPSVGQIIDSIHKIRNMNKSDMTEMAAWGYVYKAICNSNYNSELEYQALPELVQNVVGNPAKLREWAQLDTNDVQTVIQSNFMRSFRALQNRQNEYLKIPNDIKQMISSQSMQPVNIILDNR